MKQKIKYWLGIIEPIVAKDWTDEFEKMDRELWKHRQLLQKRTRTKCPTCGKSLNLWPLEEEAYYTKDGNAYHVKCYPTPTERQPKK